MNRDPEQSSKSKLPNRFPHFPFATERFLLEKLATAGEDNEAALMEMANFYSVYGCLELAIPYIEQVTAMTKNPEALAGNLLGLGGILEEIKDFQTAADIYSRALALKPTDNLKWYLAHNNLGYSLNQLEKFVEAESYCRTAIQINPDRHNAYKNLGVSLAGQGQHAEGARWLIKAVKMAPENPRAMGNLEELFRNHPEIVDEIPDFEEQFRECQESVRKAEEDFRKKMKPQRNN